MILKGQESFVDAYSCFFDNLKQVFTRKWLAFTFYTSWRHLHFQNESTLNEELQKEAITDLFLCGLATDVCVGDIWIKIENIDSEILSFSGCILSYSGGNK